MVGLRDPRQLSDSLRAAESCRQMLRDHAHELTGIRVRMGTCSVALAEYACALTSADIDAADRAFSQLQLSVEAAHVQPLSHLLEMVAAGRALAEGRQADLAACIERLAAPTNLSGGLGMSAMYYGAAALDELPVEALASYAAQPGLRGELTSLQLAAATGWFAIAAARAGSHELARMALVQVAADDLACLPQQWGDLGVLCNFAAAASELRELTRVELLYSQLAPYAALNAVGAAFDYAGSVEHFLGQMALALGRRAQAITHLQRAAAVNAALRMPLQLQRTQALLARARTA